jgi:diguanylate cyclase (GGDEF)-like protein/PAS domain S-box-containing protein
MHPTSTSPNHHAADHAPAVLRALMDASPDMIGVKSVDGVYQACNAAFASHLGLTESEVIGKADSDLLPPDVAQANQGLDEEAALAGAGERYFSEHWEVDRLGHKVCIETMRSAFFDGEGHPLGLLVVGRDVTERQTAVQTILRQSNFDTLTELPNRRYFLERLRHEVKLAQRSRLALSVLVIGLDKFKDVNELMGHEGGDALLRQVARRIQDVVRETDIAARLNGDEFAVVIHNLNDVTDVERIAQNIIRRLAEPFDVQGEKVQISASVGISVYPTNSRDTDELVKHASQAMFFAKSAGRNRFSHYTFGLQEAASQRSRLTRDLRRAVDVQQFEVYYQPVVDLRTGMVRKAEALVRWNHDGRGQIMPLDFIPLAEDNGAIIDIGDWVFREAAREVKRLREKVDPEFCISINASPVQFRSSRMAADDWKAVLSELHLPANCITLELTEGVLLKAEEFSKDKLMALRDAGFQFAIDDFGTGYSSLSYLKRFDVDFLKIDQSFVRDLETDGSDRVLCQAIIAMAHKLGLSVVAEGVETEAQQDILADAGCDFAQGFLYAKPASAAEFERNLAALR